MPLEECWRFFSDPRNLARITPPALGFTVLSTLPETIHPGLMIRYRVRPIWKIPVSWLTEITQVQRPAYFVDEQRIGPYRIWHHEHFFRVVGADRTEVRDLIHYVPPLGPLGSIINALLIRPQLERIFAFREQELTRIATATAAGRVATASESLDLDSKTALPKRPVSWRSRGTQRHQGRHRFDEEERLVGLRDGERRVQAEVAKRRRRPDVVCARAPSSRAVAARDSRARAGRRRAPGRDGAGPPKRPKARRSGTSSRRWSAPFTARRRRSHRRLSMSARRSPRTPSSASSRR